MLSNSKDVNSEVLTKNASTFRLVAAGTGDNTKQTGQTLDRAGASNAEMYQSCTIAFLAHANLAANKKLTIALEYATSADGSSWDSAVALYSAVDLLTDSGSGSDMWGAKQTGLDLSGLKRYVRFNPTADLNASGTDVAEVAVSVTFAGGRALPAT